MVFLDNYTENSKFLLNQMGRGQKFIKNSLKLDGKIRLAIIEK